MTYTQSSLSLPTLSQLQLLPEGADALMRYSAAGISLDLAAPAIEVDGQWQPLVPSRLEAAGAPRRLSNGAVEHIFRGPIGRSGLVLCVIVRAAEDSPVVRFRYVLESDRPRRLTKSTGGDAAEYFRASLAGFDSTTEIRLSDFRELTHAYGLSEVSLEQKDFDAQAGVMGPILLAGNATHHALFAYEHGSAFPDAFLQFDLRPDRGICLRATRGNYLSNQVIEPGRPWESVWFDIAAVEGDADKMAGCFREHVRSRLAESSASREPWIFYNTWCLQYFHSVQHNAKLLDTIRQDRILADIELAHRIGVEVFVIDTGWYAKTGDWAVNRERFPDGLKTVKKKLDGYGMKLGLWFDNAAGLSSVALASHRDCVASNGEAELPPEPIWETEASHRMCLVSRYWTALADEMIRLVREVGVTYFKWDAIWQYQCRGAGHEHGDSSISIKERGDRHAFLLPIYLAKIVERLSAACPEAIVDFDVTEPDRIFGLAFLSAGKFFTMNHGPYFSSFDMPDKPVPVMARPGRARNWIMRSPLPLDKWIPSCLMLAHYLPNDPAELQDDCVASLALGHNGIWGDLQSVSPEGVARLHEALRHYKQVRHDAAAASPIVVGETSGNPQWHEKIDPSTGRGVICAFATRLGTYRYVTRHIVAAGQWCMRGASVERLPDGRARITVTFVGKESGKMIAVGTAQ